MKSSAWWLATIGFVVACSTGTTSDSGSGSTGGAGDVEGFCNGLCGKEHECDQKSDEDTCFNTCKNSNAAQMPKLRADLIEDIVSCVDDSDCKKVLSSTALTNCVNEVGASASPSAAATSFCTAYVKAGDKCGLDRDKAACLTSFKFYNDAALGEAEGCTEKPCSSQSTCIKAAFGGTESGFGGGTSDGEVDAGKKDSGTGTDDTGTDDTGVVDAGVKCASVTGTTACDKCHAAECCTEYTAFSKDTQYSAFNTCAIQYPSYIDSYCSEQYPTTYPKYKSFNQCETTNCSTDCN